MIKEMFEEVFREVMLFMPVALLCQILAFAGTVAMWSITVFIGAPVSFLMLWKMLAVVALVVAIAALGQMKAKGMIP